MRYCAVIDPPRGESITLANAARMLAGAAKAESITLANAARTLAGAAKAESITLANAARMMAGAAKAESITLATTARMLAGAAEAESITLANAADVSGVSYAYVYVYVHNIHVICILESRARDLCTFAGPQQTRLRDLCTFPQCWHEVPYNATYFCRCTSDNLTTTALGGRGRVCKSTEIVVIPLCLFVLKT